LGEHVVEDYASLGLTIKRHPLAFLRAELAAEGLAAAADLATLPLDRRLAIAGLVLIRQRPGSANGVVFITLEDETGIANLIVWPAVLERFRRAALGATFLYCRGRCSARRGSSTSSPRTSGTGRPALVPYASAPATSHCRHTA